MNRDSIDSALSTISRLGLPPLTSTQPARLAIHLEDAALLVGRISRLAALAAQQHGGTKEAEGLARINALAADVAAPLAQAAKEAWAEPELASRLITCAACGWKPCEVGRACCTNCP